MPKILFQKYKKVVSTIDPSRHSSKFKEIDEAKALAESEGAYDEEEEAYYEEEMGDYVESDFSLSDGEPALNIGKIDLSFPETIEEFENSPQCYPPSYYTLSPKERLLLLYAENFRKQLVLSYPKKRAMVLALPNECKVQVGLLLIAFI
ncbi:hypothetical protein KR200_005055 [Drosophila serrata]|nr:hypothetical protein KR200_005055 [Drosophila serrata]